MTGVLWGAKITQDDKTLKLNSIRFTPTSLKGYTRSSLKGEDYSAMIYTGNTHDSLDGVLCEGLTEKDIQSLDTFEGDWYQRIPVKVTTTAVIDTETYVYIGNPELLTGTALFSWFW